MEELELTYLAKYIPEGLAKCPSKKIIDRYIPVELEHPILRLRKSGEELELTKKKPINENDSSHQMEETISLAPEEYAVLAKLPAKAVVKTRYYYPYQNKTLEIDVFEEKLSGLVLVDAEFKNKTEKEKFEMPEFCLAEVTQDKGIAGGILAGKSFDDIGEYLAKVKYVKLSMCHLSGKFKK